MAAARMDLSTVHKLHADLAGARLHFLYSGGFRDEYTARLIMLSEAVTEAFNNNDPSIRKKLAFTLVEAYQNIIRHRAPLAAEIAAGKGRSLFMLRSDGRSYEVAGKNPVRPEEADGLRSLLDRIGRNADLKQLKEMFLKGLQTESGSQRGGAGLGLIEMARRSSGGLHHRITELDTGDLMFTIHLRVGQSGTPVVELDRIDVLQAHMAALDAVFALKGEFPAVVQAALMNMINMDMASTDRHAESRASIFLAALEMIGEAGEQADDPIVVLAPDPNGLALAVGVSLEDRTARRLGDQVDALSKMEPPAIQRIYRDALLGRNADGAFTSTGLLDLARRSKAPLRMELLPHGGNSLLLVEAVA